MKYYLAIDIGASSGRHIIGKVLNNKLIDTVEIYRFKNQMSFKNGHYIWGIDNLFKEIKNGIKIAIKKYKTIESMSIDTWGVDYALLDKDDNLIGDIYAYRDERTLDDIDYVHNIISFNDLYKISGTQFQTFNSLYQLIDDKRNGKLELAETMLYIPEYLMFLLTGVKKHEYTFASTSGLLDANKKEYSKEIINKLELPNKLFNCLDRPGSIIGNFKKEIIEEVEGNILVKLCATHDTASAIEGFEMENNQIYVSSGTWSLLGVKKIKPITSSEARCANYSNEAGPNYIRFQKNIMGMWLIQNLAKQYNLDFIELVNLAKSSTFKGIYDVNDIRFQNPLDMEKEIIEYFKENNLDYPLSKKDVINSTYHSLAKSYDIAIKELEKITSSKYQKIYIVGGGAKNVYMNELVKYYTNLEVIALPIEATALGNLNIQIKGDK